MRVQVPSPAFLNIGKGISVMKKSISTDIILLKNIHDSQLKIRCISSVGIVRDYTIAARQSTKELCIFYLLKIQSNFKKLTPWTKSKLEYLKEADLEMFSSLLKSGNEQEVDKYITYISSDDLIEEITDMIEYCGYHVK